MTTKTITDQAGDTVRISTGTLTAPTGHVTVKVNEHYLGREYSAAAHADPAALRAALDEVAPLGKYTRTTPDPDDMDGGVAAALIEKEAEPPTPPRRSNIMTTYTADDFEHAHFAMHPVTGSVAIKGRMDWKWVLPGWYDTGDVSRLSDQQMADAGWVPVPAGSYTRAAAPRLLTPDAITDEMIERGAEKFRSLPTAMAATDRVRCILTAALTEPPARPEGAEEIEALLAGSWPIDREGLSAAADDLAMNGVRVVSEDGAR